MKQINIANTEMKASQIVLGCMRMNEPGRDAAKIIQTAYDHEINFLIMLIFMGVASVRRFLLKA